MKFDILYCIIINVLQNVKKIKQRFLLIIVMSLIIYFIGI